MGVFAAIAQIHPGSLISKFPVPGRRSLALFLFLHRMQGILCLVSLVVKLFITAENKPFAKAARLLSVL
jgi:hypothetical protein